MSQENAKKLVELISTKEELKAELKELSKLQGDEQVESAFAEIVKKYDCECSLLELSEAQKETMAELSPEDLAKVDAGSFDIDIGVKIGGVDIGIKF